MTAFGSFQPHSLFGCHPFFNGRLPPALEATATSEFQALWDMHPAQSNEILIHGRLVPIPRWQQAYGRDYQFSGTTSPALPVPDVLAPFLAWVREAVDDRLNGLLLNWYDAARGHYIGAHRDSRQGLVVGTPIVTISIGGTRTFRLRLPKESGFLDFEATHGTVFVMPWETNLAVKHEVPHNAHAQGRRISITARAFAQASRSQSRPTRSSTMPGTTKTVEKEAESAYTPHPCTQLFPPMSADQEADFIADIKRNGVREPIIIDEHNRIVDGVHRYRACTKLGIEPEVEQRTLTDKEAWALSISRNLYRRHLSDAARAAISAEARKAANLPVTQAEAARSFNVSERTQRSAEAVFDASPDLHRAVKDDELSVHAAEKIAKLPEPDRAAAIEKVKQGDIESAKALTKAGRTEASNKPKDRDRKAAKTTAKDAASADVKAEPVAGSTQPTTSSASSPKNSPRNKQDGEFKWPAVYAPLLEESRELVPELKKLASHLSTHPLPPPAAQHLLAVLHEVRDWAERAIKAAESK